MLRVIGVSCPCTHASKVGTYQYGAVKCRMKNRGIAEIGAVTIGTEHVDLNEQSEAAVSTLNEDSLKIALVTMTWRQSAPLKSANRRFAG